MDGPTGTTCDRCGVAAMETWQNKAGDRLDLCRHHGHQYELSLHDRGFRLVAATRVPV
ncbi:MAG: DUF7455 domain-containing protein [Mycobacteriaceae bacterium]